MRYSWTGNGNLIDQSMHKWWSEKMRNPHEPLNPSIPCLGKTLFKALVESYQKASSFVHHVCLFFFSVIVCCRHPFCLHPRPVANFLCSVFSSFSFFGSISQSHESNGGGEERRGEAGAEVRLLQTLTAATFVQLSVSGEGECVQGRGSVRERACVCVCVWTVCGTAMILWTHVFGKITLSIGSLNDYFSNVCEN